ncbi:MAG: RES domain-containing protein [Alcanivorax sp.]|nr:RES domain-containing protein [Alcanivorax sp.]
MLLQEKFCLFSDCVSDSRKLLTEIIGSDEANRPYVCSVNPEIDLYAWDNFKHEIKHENRFFPVSSLVSNFLNSETEHNAVFLNTIEQLTYELLPQELLYRGRISDNSLNQGEMGPPPAILAKGGRANPQGIPYLYLSSEKNLALSEVRPTIGHNVYISEVRTNQVLKLLDLTAPKELSTPFLLNDDQQLIFLDVVQLLEYFSNDLQRPINPNKAALDYIPTQFICEYIKSIGNFSGIVFNSAFRRGRNYVLFKQDHIKIYSPEKLSVTDTHHETVSSNPS